MRKNILKGLLCLTLAITALSFSSCKDDDYPPITLTSVSSEALLENNTLEIPLFSPGVSFYIMGGNGSYIIEAPSTDKIDYRYDGNQLTILPQALGNASLTIKWRASRRAEGLRKTKPSKSKTTSKPTRPYRREGNMSSPIPTKAGRKAW